MKKISIIFVALVWASLCVAQTNDRPKWIKELPQAHSDTYYYRVTHAEGPTYEKAYAKAFAMAIMESSWKIGVVVNKKDDVETLEKNILSNINTADMAMRIPLNKVCDYQEKVNGSMNIKLYILWQVASYGNVKPEFESFNDCH